VEVALVYLILRICRYQLKGLKMIRISEAEVELACSRIETSFDANKFAEHSGQSLKDAESYFKMSVAEAKRTLQLLDGIELSSTSKVLEIGAGLGIASSIMVKSHQ
jgi:hypothetical protein